MLVNEKKKKEKKVNSVKREIIKLEMMQLIRPIVPKIPLNLGKFDTK